MPESTVDETLEAVVVSVQEQLAKLVPSAAVAPALEKALRGTESVQDFQRVQTSLDELVRTLEAINSAIFDAIAKVADLRAEWEAERKYTEVGLEALRRELEGLSGRRYETERRWLHAILEALRAAEFDGAAAIAVMPFELADGLADGRAQIEESIARLQRRELDAGLELVEKLAANGLPGWERLLDSRIRAWAHRLAATFSIRVDSDVERAIRHANDAVQLEPRDGIDYAERANISLFAGDLERAAADAEQAIQLSPDDAAGYLALGLWTELSGEFEDAEGLYGEAMNRLTTHALSLMRRRMAPVDLSGLVFATVAERLLAAGREEAALEAASTALVEGVRGRVAYPDARVHRVRHLALAGLERPIEAADAALEAGKRYHWNGDPERAAEQLRSSIELNPDVAEARWFLADALVVLSFPSGAAGPEPGLINTALMVWQEAAERFGPPIGPDSWAYLTSSSIYNVRSQGVEGTTRDSWNALLEVERALVHDSAEGRRWGFTSRYMRTLGLDELAFEAMGRGYQLSPSDDVVLGERMALLANRGFFADASSVARELVASYGESPWVVGVQGWLAAHEQRFKDALTLFDLPLSYGYDLAWYRDLCALCHAGLEDAEAARAEYGAVLAGVADGTIPTGAADVRCIVAIAEAIAGDLERAGELLASIPAGEVAATDDGSFPAAGAFIAIAQGELDRGAELLREAIETTRTLRDVDDLETNMSVRVSLLEGGEPERRRRGDVLAEVRDDFAQRRSAIAAEDPPTVEEELSESTVERAGEDRDVASAVLLAIAARRCFEADDLQAAAAKYEELLSSVFEPQASIALAAALRRITDEAAVRGDVELTQDTQRRLAGLVEIDPIEAALTTAAAFCAAGDLESAHAELDEVVGPARAVGKGHLVEQALGDLLLMEADGAAAARHFEEALDLARVDGAPELIPRLSTRVAIAQLLDGPAGGAWQYVESAIGAWEDAGAFDPPQTTVQEARSVVEGNPNLAPLREVVTSLASIVEQVEAAQQASSHDLEERAR